MFIFYLIQKVCLKFNLFLKETICKVKSIYFSKKIDGGGGKIIFKDPFIPFKIFKEKNSFLFIKGALIVSPQLGTNTPVVIQMGMNSSLYINGDFVVGQGVRFTMSNDSTMTIGGRDKESASGITSESLISVNKKIFIGKDFLCAWNIFISDSDWHSIRGQSSQSDVIIGDHVWIANSSSILKGSVISDNCIVASHTKIANKFFPKNSLIAGIPARVVKSDVYWSRDL